MGKNLLPMQDPMSRLVAEYHELEQRFRQLKANQAPTVFESSVTSSVSFSISPLTPTVVTHRFLIVATLTPSPSTAVLMALPEISIYDTDAGSDAAGVFTGGSYWGLAGNKQYKNILDVGWWLSWGATNDHNLVCNIDVARIDYGTHPNYADNNPDGITPLTLNLKLNIRWRYLTPQ